VSDPFDLLPPTTGPSLVVAVGAGGAIGRHGSLPWHAPEDLAHFKRVTRGHTVVLGSLTWASIGRALPERRLIVVTRRQLALPEGVERSADPDDALDRAGATDPLPVVAGGASIYAALLPRVARAYVTEVDEVVADADTFFPDLDPSAWAEVASWSGADDRLTFRVLDRR
jgi:dihydrofolate reductase